MRKKRYNVTITETLEMEVEVDGKSREEAEDLGAAGVEHVGIYSRCGAFQGC